MKFSKAKLIPDTRVYSYRGVGKQTGRKVLQQLVELGEIDPMVTSTRRHLLSIEDAERIAKAL